MSHRFFLGRGFDQPTPSTYVWNATISANTTNYDIRAAAISAGWDGATPLVATITINSGVYVGSTSTSGFAIDSNSSGTFPVSSTISIINNGVIAGCGGAGGTGGSATSTGTSTYSTTNGTGGGNGGTAIRARRPISITNNGTIAGGGGGGGGAGAAAYASGGSGNACEGGGGGGGSGNAAGVGGSKGTRTDSTTDLYTYYASSGNGSTPAADAINRGYGGPGQFCGVYQLTASGNKYTWYARAYGGYGGAGGYQGSAGAVGQSGTDSAAESFSVSSGGAAGTAGYYVNGYTNITWVATGTLYGNYIS